LLSQARRSWRSHWVLLGSWVEYDAACIPDERKIQLRRLALGAEIIKSSLRQSSN
jgi:hypothetical protein